MHLSNPGNSFNQQLKNAWPNQSQNFSQNLDYFQLLRSAMRVGWMASAPIGVLMRHTAAVVNCSGKEPPNASYNNRP